MNTASKDASGHVARWWLKPGIWSELGYLTRQPLPMNHLLDISAWCDGILEGGDWASVDLLDVQGAALKVSESCFIFPSV